MNAEMKISVLEDSVQVILEGELILFIHARLLGKSDWILQAANVLVEMAKFQASLKGDVT